MMKRLTAKIAAIAALMLSPVAFAQGWSYHTSTDPMTDESKQLAWVVNNDGGTLGVACNNYDNIDIYVKIGEYTYLGNAGLPARYRVDKNPAVNVDASASNTGMSAFIRDYELADLLAVLQSGSNIVVEVIDFKRTPHLTSFSLAGSTKALKPLLSTCTSGMDKLTARRDQLAEQAKRLQAKRNKYNGGRPAISNQSVN